MPTSNGEIEDLKKRRFLQTAVASSLVAVSHGSAAGVDAEEAKLSTAVKVMIPTEYAPVLNAEQRYRLIRATLGFLQDHYSGRTIPVWGRSFEEIDFEPRVISIVYWIAQGVQQYRDIYPLDPVWVIAQIMKESYFYEYAISKSLGAGICQFLRPTAHEYGMRCAGDIKEHAQPPYQFAEFAAEAENYYQKIGQKRAYQKANKPERLSYEECLEIIAGADCPGQRPRAQEQIDYHQAIKDFNEKIAESKDRYRRFIESNVKDKDIFRDIEFLQKFDERLTYEKPVLSMIKMLCRHLRARSGNILAAAAGYQAGLSLTRDEMMYQPYGKIPTIQSTVDYLSHILVIHHELYQRL